MKKIWIGLLLLVCIVSISWLGLSRSSKAKPRIGKADKVVVWKHKRQMDLLHEGKLLRQYRISLGAEPVGHKVKEGDERTPEGLYILDWRNAQSTCYKSLHISYPNEADRERAKALGVSPGGNIMIHGILNGWGWIGKLHTWKNWTDGCVAVTNQEMDEIWQAVNNGTPIEIKP